MGAVVDVTNRDGVVEFGDRLKVFKAFRLNKCVVSSALLQIGT